LLISFEEIISVVVPTPKNKIFIADTCFIRAVFSPKEPFHKVSNDFYLTLYANNNLFCTNITTKQEIIGLIRRNLIREWAISNGYILRTDDLPRTKIEKAVILPAIKRKEYKQLQAHLRKYLKNEIEMYEKAFPYMHWEEIGGAASKSQLTVDNMVEIMIECLLDSSDAMIANYALSTTSSDGIITCDGAFQRLKDDENIFLPKVLIRA
jgi:hypothetical protein